MGPSDIGEPHTLTAEPTTTHGPPKPYRLFTAVGFNVASTASASDYRHLISSYPPISSTKLKVSHRFENPAYECLEISNCLEIEFKETK